MRGLARVRKCRTLSPMTPEQIRTWHESRGLSRAEFAQLLGVSKRTVDEWAREDRRGEPPPYFWRALEHLDAELKRKKKRRVS